MGTHIYKAIINGVEKSVEITDLAKKGCMGFHYNYMFLVNMVSSDKSKWHTSIHRPGCARCFLINPGTSFNEAMEAIELDYKQRGKRKTKR